MHNWLAILGLTEDAIRNRNKNEVKQTIVSLPREVWVESAGMMETVSEARKHTSEGIA